MHLKRKKTTRLRGSHTHGGGSKKKRRGAGHRGGRGNAGSGKRGDAKKPSYWKIKERSGKHGFKSKVDNDYSTINIGELQNKIESLVVKNKAQLKNDTYIINLNNIKRDKLLGAGKINKKFEITCTLATETAIKKIESAGGKVILPKQESSATQ
jgi:large subunit ribosomal protein L15